MTTIAKKTDFIQAHESAPVGMMFYDSLEAVRSDIDLIGYVSVIERAWQEMKLHGVLCLDTKPVLYLKEHGRQFSYRERIRLQKLFWNQGVANILVLADPKSVYLYSGLTNPKKEPSNKDFGENALIEKLKCADYVLRIKTFFHDLASGHYYEKKQSFFDPQQTVDAWLLDNLRALRDTLIQGNDGLKAKEAHAFIGRVLFLCYLLDRGIVSVGSPNPGGTATMLLAEKLEISTHKERIAFLYGLFDDLKIRFNGNMFDQDLTSEKQYIQPEHINKLILFLGGHEVESGQRSLGFWPYDFKMIPVEAISAIYEDFLSTEDSNEQRGRGAFYTPRFLAEMVVDRAVREEPELLDRNFLDPACGSGIFLVILFNRLANRWIHTQNGLDSYITRANALRDILARRIRGVDIEETACRIACFSLYLAYLDFFDPPDIRKHIARTGRPLPKLLNYGDTPNRPDADIPVILKADFLSEETLSGEKFQCIIGNPPWQGRGRKQLAQKFLQKVPHFLIKNGIGCMLLPTKILQNQTDAFQAKWLTDVTLQSVLQMADYSFLLFQNALCPAFIARFKNTPAQPTRHMVEFTAPKFNRDGLRQGVVTVNPSSRTWLPLADILEATRSETTPVVWKRRLWGSPRDQKLLDMLHSLPSLREHVDVLSELRIQRRERTKRWIIGQGLKPWPLRKTKSDRPPKKITWPLTTLFIESSPWNSDLLALKEDAITFEDRLRKKSYRLDALYSRPPSELFCQPMVLVSQGFRKVAYCDFDVLFQHSLQSIAGPSKDKDLLMFLSAYLRSNLARYFLFHTSANWGSERDKVHLNELLRVPFPLPGHEFISSGSHHIIKQVSQKFTQYRKSLKNAFKNLKAEAGRSSLFDNEVLDISKKWKHERKILTNALQQELEPLIYDYFDLTDQEIILIEDTIRVFEPSSTPTTWRSQQTVTLNPIDRSTVEPYATEGLGAYADTLTDTLNSWAKAEGSNYRICAKGGTDKNTGLAMVSVELAGNGEKYQIKPILKNLVKTLDRLNRHSSKMQGTLLYQRDILFFQGKQVHIVRPNILLNWTRTAALNDAARIYGDITLARKENS